MMSLCHHVLSVVAGELNQKIDELEGMAIQSDAIPLDADTSRLLSSMNARIKELENKIDG